MTQANWDLKVQKMLLRLLLSKILSILNYSENQAFTRSNLLKFLKKCQNQTQNHKMKQNHLPSPIPLESKPKTLSSNATSMKQSCVPDATSFLSPQSSAA